MGEEADADAALVDPRRVPRSRTRIDCAQKGLEYIATFDLDMHRYHELPLYIQIKVLREGRIVRVKRDQARVFNRETITVLERVHKT